MGAPWWLHSVDAIFAGLGVPSHIWLAIAVSESNGDPTARGDAGASIGLFQLYTKGGQGDGYSIEELLNPIKNASVAAVSIAAAYREWGDNIIELARHSGHPNTNLSPDDPWLKRMAVYAANFKGKSVEQAWFIYQSGQADTPGYGDQTPDPDGYVDPNPDNNTPDGQDPDEEAKDAAPVQEGIAKAIADALGAILNPLADRISDGIFDNAPGLVAIIVGVVFVGAALYSLAGQQAKVSVGVGAG